MIDCRGGWSLRDFDTNEAGQVHAYICDLRNLPYQEQLYWKSFNESLGPTYLRELSETTSLTNRLTRPHWQSY
jgi:hypothetical protein